MTYQTHMRYFPLEVAVWFVSSKKVLADTQCIFFYCHPLQSSIKAKKFSLSLVHQLHHLTKKIETQMKENNTELHYSCHGCITYSISPHAVTYIITLQLQKAHLKAMRIKCPHLIYLFSFDSNNISTATVKNQPPCHTAL